MLDSVNFALQLDLAFRLVMGSVLGALIGLERELHAQPAGIRTHLLVSFGAALFTVLSIYGFVDVLGPGEGSPPDPTRIAAQVVTGIGFLGAGAILKYGTSIRGLTTAGSLWATAAIGMAAGAGQLGIAVAGTAIVIFSLWPLNWIVDRLQIGKEKVVRVRLQLGNLDALGAITRELADHRVELVGRRRGCRRGCRPVSMRRRAVWRISLTDAPITRTLNTICTMTAMRAPSVRAWMSP